MDTSKTVYLITAHETEDSIGFGVDFSPEAYTSKETATARHASLQALREEASGIYYSLQAVALYEKKSETTA